VQLTLAFLLTVIAGYVDTAGFLALQGLFTAHVTGNFVTLGAALVNGTSGILAKVLALPVFCAVIALVRAADVIFAWEGLRGMRLLLAIHFVLLGVGTALAMLYGPFHDGDTIHALLTGMFLVAAMAVQGAIHRIYLPTAPPTTMMTGSTIQLVLDGVDMLRRQDEDQRSAVSKRARRLGASVGAFAVGCGAAALVFAFLGKWCFIAPPLLALAAVRAKA
jgi:uncharacterized membrane protein YoaK (UPF0700 family)